MRVLDHSPASMLAARLVESLGRERAHRAMDALLERFSTVEIAALGQWWGFWARSKQRAPAGDWRSWGFLAGRGLGKTKGVVHHLNDEIEAGRIKLLCLIAQDEQSSIDIQVNGPSGIVTVSPPWFRAEWVASSLQIVWPNGAKAYVRTPEVPGKIRGLEYHASWATEFQSWPVATRMLAYDNVLLSTRLGYARLIWDATPQRRHPILLDRLALAKADPDHHVIVRGSTYENLLNLGTGYVEELERKFAGTDRGREELAGEMLEDAEGATAKDAWIGPQRRPRAAHVIRAAVGVDPAITARKGSDSTGIVAGCLGADGHLYVTHDRSGKYGPAEWAGCILDLWAELSADVIVAETNRGGDLVVQNIRAAAAARGLRVEVTAKDWIPHREAGIVFVREVHSRGSKTLRAQPLSIAYEQGRVHHVLGVDLSSLESTLTGWVARDGDESPDDLDALVSLAVELLNLSHAPIDYRKDFDGLSEMGRRLLGTSAPGYAGSAGVNLASLLGAGGGERI